MSQAAYQQSLIVVPITVHAVGETPARVSALFQYHLLRIAREAVANAGRHADPTRIEVYLRAGSEGLVLEVIDDGIGFDVAAGESRHGHFGLRGMRERARRMGATLMIDSEGGRGTKVSVRIPPDMLHGEPKAMPDSLATEKDHPFAKES